MKQHHLHAIGSEGAVALADLRSTVLEPGAKCMGGVKVLRNLLVSASHGKGSILRD